MNLNRGLCQNNRFSMIDLEDEILFIPSDENDKSDNLYKAADLASITICRDLHAGKTPKEIVDHLVQMFDIEYSIVETDVSNFINLLLQRGIFYE